ncbi:type II secretion system F family protein [Microbacterium sp.]|uniref:type II secretion system F family protein n=1 Tax=Microbacterium sp. TaxID=51671 RepID=UPI003A863D38
MIGALTDAAVSIVLGGALAAGILLLAMKLPRWSAPSLSRRIAPYVREVTDPQGLTPLRAPVIAWRERGLRLIGRIGGAEAVQRRMSQAGWRLDATVFRGRQLGWTIAGVVVGGLVAVALTILGRGSPGLILLPPVLGFVAAGGYDVRLTMAARARVARVEEELPTILEFIALCLAAGEGLRDALRRVGEVGSGELTAEIRAVVLATGTGSTMTDALASMSRRVDLPALSRSVDHLIAAVERGAPLAQVLQAQAVDAREEAKRVLIEQAGRKEIQMLLPLVFLILPLSVLFAVFPGIVMLRLGLG